MENKLNELQVRILAIVQVIEGVTVSGPDNWRRLMSAISELNKLAKDAEGKALITVEANQPSDSI